MIPDIISLKGCILGTAAGDSLGLPCEGLSSARIRKMFPDLSDHHFIFGKGMCSDDTEHTVLLSEALLESGGDADKFAKKFAHKLKLWLITLPAGIGKATLLSCLKLLFFVPPEKSGVFSAGNGPAMKAAVLGVLYGDEPEKLKEMVKIASRISHTDPKAEYGALAVAKASYMSAMKVKKEQLLKEYPEKLNGLLPKDPAAEELMDRINKCVQSVKAGESIWEYCKKEGMTKGISGYTYHTVPAVIHSWLSNPYDFEKAVKEIIYCGGDTDTTAAVLGGIIGAGVGAEGIPQKWIKNIWEFPRSVKWMEKLALCLLEMKKTGNVQKTPAYNYFLIFPRNFIFVMTLFAHIFRRMLPPYSLPE